MFLHYFLSIPGEGAPQIVESLGIFFGILLILIFVVSFLFVVVIESLILLISKRGMKSAVFSGFINTVSLVSIWVAIFLVDHNLLTSLSALLFSVGIQVFKVIKLNQINPKTLVISSVYSSVIVLSYLIVFIRRY